MSENVIVYGPQACGKTRNAARIAKAFGLKSIVDDWGPGVATPASDALILTNITPNAAARRSARVMTFEQAMRAVTPAKGARK